MHPFDDLFVCADAGIYKKGGYVANLGVAIEFQNYGEFRREYSDTIDDLSSKYGISFPRRVVKGSDVYRIVRDHEISVFVSELANKLLSSKSISGVQAVHTILKNEVKYPWRSDVIPGIEFVKNHLANYYAVVPIYEYYFNGGKSESVVVDGVTGYMTKAWLEVAERAKKGLYVVPHGDLTHPCLSICDLAITAIKHQVYPLSADKVEGFLVDRVSKGTTVNSDFISDGLVDLIRAKYPHHIKPEKYYLHPLYLLDRGEDLDERLISETDVYALAHEQAEKYGGSSFNIKAEDFLRILQPGDIVICLTDKSHSRMKVLSELNPRRELKALSVREFLEHIEKDTEEEIRPPDEAEEKVN